MRWVVITAVGAILLVLATSCRSPEGLAPAEQSTDEVEAISDIAGDPLPGGVETTLDEAVARIGFDLFRPDIELASDASIEAIWVRGRGESTDVWIEYESGVALSVDSADEHQDLETYVKAQEADGVPLSVERIEGRDAVLIPPGEGSGGAVLLWFDDVRASIYGKGNLTADQLLEVGESVVERAIASQAGA